MRFWMTVEAFASFRWHIHAQTVGYAVISIDEDTADIIRYYEFFLNVCNALDMSKTQRRQQTIIQNLENKYVHDPLTGLFNRRGFYMNIKSDFEKCVEEQQKFKLLSVDLNGLKVSMIRMAMQMVILQYRRLRRLCRHLAE